MTISVISIESGSTNIPKLTRNPPKLIQGLVGDVNGNSAPYARCSGAAIIAGSTMSRATANAPRTTPGATNETSRFCAALSLIIKPDSALKRNPINGSQTTNQANAMAHDSLPNPPAPFPARINGFLLMLGKGERQSVNVCVLPSGKPAMGKLYPLAIYILPFPSEVRAVREGVGG